MPILTEAQVLAALKKRSIPPVIALVGDDDVGKSALIEALSDLVEDDLKPFNLQRIYANERPVEDIVNAVRTLPFLGERRVVIALRCEVFLKTKSKAGRDGDDEGGSADRSEADAPAVLTSELERYLASPAPENLLVLVAGDATRNTRIWKQLVSAASIVEYWGLKGDRDARGRDIEQALVAGERFVKDTVR